MISVAIEMTEEEAVETVFEWMCEHRWDVIVRLRLWQADPIHNPFEGIREGFSDAHEHFGYIFHIAVKAIATKVRDEVDPITLQRKRAAA